MNKSRVILFIVIILIIVSVVLYFKNTNSTIKKELRDFAVEDTSAVTKIFMVNKSNQQVKLERKNGYWKVNDKYAARKDAINLLLKTMNRLEVKSPVPKSAHNTIVKNLSSRSVKVEIYTDKGLIRTYYVGGPTADQYGTYMLIEDSSVPFIMHIPGFNGYLSTRYFVEEDLWRATQIFNYNFNEISTISVELPLAPSQSFRVYNYGDNKFALESLYEKKMVADFDTIEVKKYIAYYKNISFQAMLNNLDQHKKDSIISTTPFYILTVEDINGFKHSLKTFKMPSFDNMLVDDTGNELEFDPDQCYGYVDDKEMVSVQYYNVDPLFKEIDDFVKK